MIKLSLGMYRPSGMASGAAAWVAVPFGVAAVWAGRPGGTAKPASRTTNHRPPGRRAEVIGGRTPPRVPVAPIRDRRTGAVLILLDSPRVKHDWSIADTASRSFPIRP